MKFFFGFLSQFHSLHNVMVKRFMYCFMTLCTAWWLHVYCLMTLCTAWWLHVLLDDFTYCLMTLCTDWWIYVLLDDFMYWLINLLTADDFMFCLMTLCSAWWLYLLLDGLMYCLTTFDYYCMDYIILVENNNNLFSSFETQNRITLENN